MVNMPTFHLLWKPTKGLLSLYKMKLYNTTNSIILARLENLSDNECLFYGQIFFLRCSTFQLRKKKDKSTFIWHCSGFECCQCSTLHLFPFSWYISLSKGRIWPQDIHDNMLDKESVWHNSILDIVSAFL